MVTKDYYFKLFVLNNNINYLKYMIALSTTRCQRLYYEEQLFNQITRYKYWQKKLGMRENNNKIFTINELSKYDGANGNPAYVAIDGKVYDVSNEATWGGGTHFGFYAGKNLTENFYECHSNNLKILEDLPIVGVLDE